MNDQDRDLILAFASGQLSAADAEAASVHIASDPDLAAELAAQELAISSLSTVPAVALTSSERDELRSNLIAQLNLAAAPVAAAPAKRTAKWWQPVAGLAAAAAVVAAFIILPGNLGSDDASDVALQPNTATARVEEETLTSADGSGGEAGSPNEATTTSEATTTAGVESDSAAEEQDDFGGADVLAATEGSDTPAEAEDGLDTAQYKLAPLAPNRSSAIEACLERLSDGLPAGDIITLGTKDLDGTETLFIGITDETGIASVASIALEPCQIVEIAR